MAKVQDTPDNESLCMCPDCPSFPMEGNLFCARAKSQNPVRQRGCLCPDCEVFKDYSLQDDYYCADGAAG